MALTISRIKAKVKGVKYLPFEQDGKTHNLYDMPKGFVIKGDLDLSDKGLTELPDLSDVIVEGEFRCDENQLTTLEGAPQKVGGTFYCGYNHLTTLEGAPHVVGGDFNCGDNLLTDLKGAPHEVGGSFYCIYNKLITLKGVPKKVGENFDCSHNDDLTSLLGVPALEKDNLIMCDDTLGEKYGFANSNFDGFTFQQLSESTLYKSEVAADNNIRHKQEQDCVKKQQQERAEKQRQATEKTKNAFDAWLKNKGIETPAR